METEHLAALRQAATALINAAAPPIVLATLRMLLDGTEIAAPPHRPPTPRPSPQPPAANRVRARPVPARRQTPQPDSAWDARRKELRQAMLDRDVGYEELAERFGVAPRTLRHALGRRQLPTTVMRQRLEAWFAQDPAPAVAAEPTFRGNGASRVHDSDWTERPAG